MVVLRLALAEESLLSNPTQSRHCGIAVGAVIHAEMLVDRAARRATGMSVMPSLMSALIDRVTFSVIINVLMAYDVAWT